MRLRFTSVQNRSLTESQLSPKEVEKDSEPVTGAKSANRERYMLKELLIR